MGALSIAPTDRSAHKWGQVLQNSISVYNAVMARPLRIELAGGLYHVTSRGVRREDIYLSDADRVAWLQVLQSVCERFN